MASKIKPDSVPLREQLEKLEKSGIKLYLNGVPSTTEHIVKKCIREDSVYMPDYIQDESGKLREVRYDRISLK